MPPRFDGIHDVESLSKDLSKRTNSTTRLDRSCSGVC